MAKSFGKWYSHIISLHIVLYWGTTEQNSLKGNHCLKLLLEKLKARPILPHDWSTPPLESSWMLQLEQYKMDFSGFGKLQILRESSLQRKVMKHWLRLKIPNIPILTADHIMFYAVDLQTNVSDMENIIFFLGKCHIHCCFNVFVNVFKNFWCLQMAFMLNIICSFFNFQCLIPVLGIFVSLSTVCLFLFECPTVLSVLKAQLLVDCSWLN